VSVFNDEIHVDEIALCRHLRREETVKEEASRGLAALSSGPKLDLSFKEGQTITINMPVSTVLPTSVFVCRHSIFLATGSRSLILQLLQYWIMDSLCSWNYRKLSNTTIPFSLYQVIFPNLVAVNHKMHAYLIKAQTDSISEIYVRLFETLLIGGSVKTYVFLCLWLP